VGLSVSVSSAARASSFAADYHDYLAALVARDRRYRRGNVLLFRLFTFSL
jgi:hypothetical protein